MSNNKDVSNITNPNTNPETEGRIHPDFPNYPIFTEPLPPRGSALKQKTNSKRKESFMSNETVEKNKEVKVVTENLE